MPRSSAALVSILVLAIALFAAAMATLVLPIQPPLTTSGGISQTPTVNITIYGGEISASKYGFGSSPNNLSSPGPTLRFNVTDVVKLTFVNAGAMPHAFAITDAPRSTANVLFKATVGSSSNPLDPGKNGTVIFAPNIAGDQYFYICPIPGHAENLGMWGSVVVSP